MALDITPLFDLRLRTPRLELRLPVQEELELLREVALAGIHPPEFMPFAVAWTDDPELAGFAAYHEQLRESWSPDSWHLELAVWTGDEPTGFQALVSEEFTRTRRVGTGSWLGSRFQRRGYGTEMRTAVLELAFRGLDAQIARSGAIDGNTASLRVSERLGYRISAARRSHRAVSPCRIRISSCGARTGCRRSQSRSPASSPAYLSSASRVRSSVVATHPERRAISAAT